MAHSVQHSRPSVSALLWVGRREDVQTAKFGPAEPRLGAPLNDVRAGSPCNRIALDARQPG